MTWSIVLSYPKFNSNNAFRLLLLCKMVPIHILASVCRGSFSNILPMTEWLPIYSPLLDWPVLSIFLCVIFGYGDISKAWFIRKCYNFSWPEEPYNITCATDCCFHSFFTHCLLPAHYSHEKTHIEQYALLHKTVCNK